MCKKLEFCTSGFVSSSFKHASSFARLDTPELQSSSLEASNFCTEMGDRMMKQLHWAYTARGAYKCEKSPFCLVGKVAIQVFSFQVLEVQPDSDSEATVTFHRVWQSILLFTGLHGPCNDSKHGKQKKHGPSFACRRRRRGTPVAIARHHSMFAHAPLADPEKNGLLILWRALKGDIILNHFEGVRLESDSEHRPTRVQASAWRPGSRSGSRPAA